ncbi:MAG: CDP-alcohol phosphatidyltransferase family protein [Bacteroidaceae bacterium]|nr:CDP-alcohol phosphatidyltransferase family protein [Bacteroidaceae bacterium]
MKRLPNIITVLRIVGSFCLLLVSPPAVTAWPSTVDTGWFSLLHPLSDVTGMAFWLVYGFCGISDIADGWLARKLGCATKTGALLDSLADICFVVCCALRLLPILEFPIWLLIWAGVIVVIKIINQVSALVMCGRCCFLHTLANKVTGFLLFLAVPVTFWSITPIFLVAAVATFAAIQEGHLIRTKC